MARKTFPVSVKAAIFNTNDELLMIFMDRRGEYGLPGGHIDEGELPDDAMRRELAEETGVQDYKLHRADFFMHEEGKLILGYVGMTDSRSLAPTQGTREGKPTWVDRDAFAALITNQCYRDFVNKFWM